MTDDNRSAQDAKRVSVEDAIARNLEAHRSYYDSWLNERRAEIHNELSDDQPEQSLDRNDQSSNVLLT